MDDGELVEALAALYSYVCSIPREDVRVAAEQRAIAMVHSHRWVDEGCVPSSHLIGEERTTPVRS